MQMLLSRSLGVVIVHDQSSNSSIVLESNSCGPDSSFSIDAAMYLWRNASTSRACSRLPVCNDTAGPSLLSCNESILVGDDLCR